MPKKLSKSSTVSSFSTASLPPSLSDPSLPLPKLIVFDLDYTLWAFWVDTHVSPPIKSNADHTAVTDRIGDTYSFYDDVPAILNALSQSGVKIGVASRTHAPALARDMLKLLHIPSSSSDETPKARRALEVFDALEIYPGSKIKHFESLAKKTGIRYEDMLFFDDEARNRDTESLGVTMWLVRDGVCWDEVEKGVGEWRKRRGVGGQ